MTIRRENRRVDRSFSICHILYFGVSNRVYENVFWKNHPIRIRKQEILDSDISWTTFLPILWASLFLIIIKWCWNIYVSFLSYVVCVTFEISPKFSMFSLMKTDLVELRENLMRFNFFESFLKQRHPTTRPNGFPYKKKYVLNLQKLEIDQNIIMWSWYDDTHI